MVWGGSRGGRARPATKPETQRRPRGWRGKLLTIRKAEWRDVPALHRLINYYAAERIVLPRSMTDLYENIREFTLGEEAGKLLGCGALKCYNREVAEIRSLCVAAAVKSNGVGRAITRALMDEAGRSGLNTIFALTTSPAFFGKLGGAAREVPRQNPA